MSGRFYQHWLFNGGRARPIGIVLCEEHSEERAQLQPAARVVRLSPSQARGRKCSRCGAVAEAEIGSNK